MKERRLCSPSPFNHAQQKKRTKRLHRGPSRAGQQRRFYTLTHLTSSSTSQPNQNEKRDPPDKTELPRQLSHGTKRTANEIEEATTKHYIAANGLTTRKDKGSYQRWRRRIRRGRRIQLRYLNLLDIQSSSSSLYLNGCCCIFLCVSMSCVKNGEVWCGVDVLNWFVCAGVAVREEEEVEDSAGRVFWRLKKKKSFTQ